MSLRRILKSIISEGFEGTQQELCTEINKRGTEVNQSSVSRALGSLNAQKLRGKWVIVGSTPHAEKIMSISDHVTNVLRNESLIIVKTLPGSAHYVGSYLDRRSETSILGTVAGDDSILVIPTKTKEIDSTFKILKDVLGIQI